MVSSFLTLVYVLIFISNNDLYHFRTNKNQLGDVDKHEQNVDIIIYSALIAGLFLTTIIRSISFFAICMRASVRLHNKIFARLLRAPVAFFDSNPAGRILNRCSKDLGLIDETFPFVAFDLNLVRKHNNLHFDFVLHFLFVG